MTTKQRKSAVKCDDRNCPVHGNLKTRGRKFVGTVVKSKAQKTATVEWSRKRLVPKYERYEKRMTRIKAHNPPCIDVKKGDRIEISECRPISKTKRFVVLKKLGRDIDFLEKEERMEEKKVKREQKVKKEESVNPEE